MTLSPSPLPPAVAEELDRLADHFARMWDHGEWESKTDQQYDADLNAARQALHHFVAERSQPDAAWIAWLESEAVRLEAWQPAPDPIGPLHGAGLGTAAKSFAQHYRKLAAKLRASPSGEPQRPHTWSPAAIKAAWQAREDRPQNMRAALDAAWSVDFGGAQQETKP